MIDDMRIILFIDNLGSGGAQRQLVGLADMLNKKGYQVKVCYYQDDQFYYGFLDENAVSHQLIKDARNHYKRIFSVRNFLIDEKPDWVIAYQETPSLIACAAKVLGCKYKLIVSERNTTQYVGIRDRVRFILYHFADAIVPNSYSQANFLINNYPWMSPRLKVISNFVNINHYYPTYHQRATEPIIMVAASIWKPKNTLTFIKAIGILSELLSIKVRWYGLSAQMSEANKAYVNECFSLIEELRLSNVISLLPKTHQIAEKYREADFFCLPSLYEGTPNVICEALASGLPIICSNVCDNPVYVQEGVNGFLFNPNDPSDMAKKLELALRLSDNDYSLFCKSSRAVAENLLSEETFISSYTKIIL